MSSSRPAALVIVLSDVRNDPRVHRQIEWLAEEGWVVDSLGLGESPDLARNHFEIAPRPAWTETRWGRGLFHAVLSNAAKFRLLATNRFPKKAAQLIRAGEYDAIIFNDIDLIGWLRESETFAGHKGTIHLDIHEYFPPRLPPGSLLRFRVESYYQWTRSFINHSRINTRSVVASGIGDLYSSEFSIAAPAIVRNCPPYEELTPTDVDAADIRLLYHGGAHWVRGLREIISAAPLLENRFRVTFMLTGALRVIDEVKEATSRLSDRVSVIPAVAMPEVAQAINEHDLEVMFYPPATQNLLLALPNKLFEGIQGRLGLVVGESPMMRDIVESTGNGIVVSGWGASDLASALNALNAEQIAEMKAASHRVAAEFSAEHEKTQFLAVLSVR